MKFLRLFLDGDGRIGRQDFWIGIFILIVANIILGYVAGLVGWAVAGIWGAAILAGLVGLAMSLPFYFLLVKRSNDRNYPPTYVQALMALNIAFQIKNMVIPIEVGGPSLLSMLFSLTIAVAGLWVLLDLGLFPSAIASQPFEDVNGRRAIYEETSVGRRSSGAEQAQSSVEEELLRAQHEARERRRRASAEEAERMRQESERQRRENEAPKNHIKNAEEILGLTDANYDYASAKLRYITLVKNFASDTGGSSRLQQQINDAWDTIKRAHGWK